MPITTEDPIIRPFNSYMPEFQMPEPPKDPAFVKETVPAVMDIFNIVKSMYDINQRQKFKEDSTLDLQSQLKSRGLWEDRDLYIDARSGEEITYRQAEIQKQRNNLDIYARSGYAGTIAAIGASLLDPSIGVPFLKGATALRTAMKSAALMGGISAVEEIIFSQAQFERTGAESALNIGAATILGGVLGRALHSVLPGEFDRIASGMADVSDTRYVLETPTPFDQPSTAGAVQVRGQGGKLKSTGSRVVDRATLDQLSKTGPITRGIQQPSAPSFMPQGSEVWRTATSKFGQAGLKLEHNIEGFAGSPGGNIEHTIGQHVARLDVAQREIEDAYKEYIFAAAIPRTFPLTRARIAGHMTEGKMDFPTFRREVSLARAEGTHADPFVMKAANAATKLIDETYKQAVEVGVFTGKEAPKGDVNFLSHVWDRVAVKSDALGLTAMLKRNFQRSLDEEFSKKLDKELEKQRKANTYIEDVERSDADIEKLRKQFEEDLRKHEEALPFELAQIELEAINLRAGARKLEGANKRATFEMAKKVELEGGPELKAHKVKRAEIKSRLENLKKARVVVEEKLAAKISKIERNEELQINTIWRVAQQLQKVIKLIDKGSDKAVETALSKLKTAFEKTAKAFDDAEEQIVRMTNAEDNAIGGVLERQESRMNKLDDLAERIENIDTFDKVAFKAEAEAIAKELIQVHAEINARRALRNERLRAQAAKLSPEEFQARLAARKSYAKSIIPAFVEKWTGKASNKIDLEKRTADFSEYAQQAAEETVQKLKGVDRRLAYSDLMNELRGTEHTRVLRVSMKEAWPWLVHDIQENLAIYMRTLGTDIEVKRVFGSTDLANVIKELNDEETRALNAIGKLKNKKGEPISESASKSLQNETASFYAGARKDIYTLLERARGMRGIPSDPDAASYRLGRTALHINNLRYMGKAVIASIADPGRIIQRHTLLRTFRDGFIPLITSFKTFKMSVREAREAGLIDEMVMHTRINAMMGVWDDTFRGTLAERGIQYASTHMGLLSGISAWTEAFNQVTAGVVNARLIDSIGVVMGEKATAREIRKATEFLASVNITHDIAEVIHREVSNGIGGNTVRGIKLPNTALWNVADPNVKRALRAYRAALSGEITDTIIRPGFELPSFMDKNIGGKMLGQFKSFGFSSTQKTLMAGLQEHDVAYLNGVLITLALGALSYYLYGVATGGAVYDKMMKSIDEGDWQLWADEAISRSGQTAIFDSLQRVATRIPIINKYTSFSGAPITKTSGGGLHEELLGPSFDLMMRAERMIAGIDDPDMGTLHAARMIMAFQNMWYLTRLNDKVENAIGDAFGLEGKRR